MKHRGAGMVNILVVEDDQHYRTYLCRALSRDGYNVRGAATGRDGVAVGSRFRPRVLVVNWMLGDDLNGLDVASVLQAVDEDLQTILITGFSLSDVADAMTKQPIFRIIEKPFELKELVNAVHQATLSQRPAEERASIALIEVDCGGTVVFANSMARDLLGLTHAERDVGSLSGLFSPDPVPDLDAAAKRWVTVSSKAKQPTKWQIRTQAPPRPGRTRLVVVGRPHEMVPETLRLVDTLLENERLPLQLEGDRAG